MSPGLPLIVFYFASIGGAVASPALAYWLVGRGYSASKALRITTLVSGVLLAVAVTPLALLLVGLAGLAGVAGIIGLIVFFLAQYLLAPYIVLRGLRLRRPGPGEEWLVKTLRRLQCRVGYTGRVELYIAEDDVPNAFAVSTPLKKVIVVNSGLLEKLDREEVEAVLAHELGHIVHRDSSYMMATSFAPSAAYLLGITLILAGILMAQAVSEAANAARTYSYYRRNSNEGLAVLAGISLALSIIAIGAILAAISFIVNLAVLAFSRTREHLADAFSVQATRSTRIVQALAKIEQAIAEKKLEEREDKQLAITPRLRNMLYIIPRIYSEGYRALYSFYPQPRKWLSPLSTHPPTEARAYIAFKVYEEIRRICEGP